MVSQLGERLPSFTPEESAKLNGRQTSLVQVSVSVSSGEDGCECECE